MAIEQFQKTMLTFLLPLKSLSRLLLRLFCGLRFGFREGTCFLFSYRGTFAATRFAGVFAFAAIDCGYFRDPFAACVLTFANAAE